MDDEKFNLIEELNNADVLLERGLVYADAFVSKNYLSAVTNYGLVDMPIDGQVNFYLLDRIVYDMEESLDEKLINVYTAISNVGAGVSILVNSTEKGIEFYIGVKHADDEIAEVAKGVLEKSFKGNFSGSQLEEIYENVADKALDNYVTPNISSVSIVPAKRNKESAEANVQGIEKFIDTMRGYNYTALLIAEPISKENLELNKRGLFNLSSSISHFKSTQLTYGENSSVAVSKGMSDSFSKSLNESITDTTSQFRNENYSKNYGMSRGFFGIGFNTGSSSGFSTGNSWAHGVTSGTTETNTVSTSTNKTETTGDSKSITVTNENKRVNDVLESIDRQLERIKKSESFGFWNVASYFISDEKETALVAASTFKALLSGAESDLESSQVNLWEDSDDNTHEILYYLKYAQHPRFAMDIMESNFETDDHIITAGNMVSGDELPLVLSLPKYSVPGLPVIKIADFGRNIQYSSKTHQGKTIPFGSVFHMGAEDPERVNLSLENFRSHCFITGSTGSGKSNTTYKILDEMIENNIPFLVIEPAKGEYKRYYGALENINVFCTNPSLFSLLRINPFSFNDKIHVLEHLDRLIEIFNACWPLYAAMPAILKDSFEQAYIKAGWDLENSIYIPVQGKSKYPTFYDVLEILPEVINESSYSDEAKGNYIGALVTRVRSLTNGITGQVLCDENEISDEDLFDETTIVDLSRIASLETKSLLMGILILKLNEYRMSESSENQPLRHVTILEEAHNILKRTSGGGAEGANVQAKSVEMISSAIAEMRTYGEGFIIVDQSPTAVDVSAIKNTNTKIIMRLPDYEDAKISGLSMGLNENQINEISKLPMGVAAVFQNNWVEAVLVKIDKSEEIYHQEDMVVDNMQIAQVKGKIVERLLEDYEEGFFEDTDVTIRTNYTEELKEIVNETDINSFKKQELREAIVSLTASFDDIKVRNGLFAKQLMSFTKTRGLFSANKIKLSKNDYVIYTGFSKKDIDKNDLKIIKNWYDRIFNNLDNYLIFEEEVAMKKRKIIRYLLTHLQREYIEENRYHIIEVGVFNKKYV